MVGFAYANISYQDTITYIVSVCCVCFCFCFCLIVKLLLC